MTDLTSRAEELKKLRSIKRQSVNLTRAEWVKTGFLDPSSSLPLLVFPAMDGVNLWDWIVTHQDWIDEKLKNMAVCCFEAFP